MPVPATGRLGDQAVVDLEDVDRQRAQLAQRRVAGAEVVQRDPHPGGAQRARAGGSARRCRWPPRARSPRAPAAAAAPVRAQHLGDLRRRTPAACSSRGETLTDTQTSCPSASQRESWWQAWCSTHAPSRSIRPDSSATGMNSSGRHAAQLRVVPAQQRLGADRPHRRQRHHRLEDQDQLVALDRAAQLVLERAAPAQQLVVRGVVRARPGSCRAAWRSAGPGRRCAAASRCVGARRSRPARCWPRGRPAAAGCSYGLAEHGEQPLGHRARPRSGRAHISTANSSPPSRAATSPGRRLQPQPLADLDQHRVADVVAAHVVDVLEAVEVEAEQHARRRRRAASSCSARSSPRRLARPVSGSVCASSRKCASLSASRPA